jgi:RNA recognition motif-containing protein
MTKKLFVGSLTFELTSQELEQIFAEVGKVESANIITDRETGRSRGFGFVEMSTEDEAKQAIEKLNGKDVGGRKIVVAEAKPQPERSDRPRQFDRS